MDRYPGGSGRSRRVAAEGTGVRHRYRIPSGANVLPASRARTDRLARRTRFDRSACGARFGARPALRVLRGSGVPRSGPGPRGAPTFDRHGSPSHLRHTGCCGLRGLLHTVVVNAGGAGARNPPLEGRSAHRLDATSTYNCAEELCRLGCSSSPRITRSVERPAGNVGSNPVA